MIDYKVGDVVQLGNEVKDYCLIIESKIDSIKVKKPTCPKNNWGHPGRNYWNFSESLRDPDFHKLVKSNSQTCCQKCQK